MINFEQYLAERKGSSVTQPKPKRKVNIEELKQMIANKDSSIANVDVSEITDMKELFKNSDFGGSWTADLSGWDTSGVKDMSWMFFNCKNLTKVELPNTGNVENMNNMFCYCTNLTKVELPKTGNVTDMHCMFEGCTNLTKVELPHTDNVTNMWSMFNHCSNLTKVELPHTENVVDMSWMFEGCENLEQNFSSWDITNVNQKSDMFKGCVKMKQAKKNKINLYPKGY